ncbi:MAG: hypothetical protein IJ955_00675 [Oscillospiraceae bacterium]|nr:hypothetical protein [Oscillospiraceae bacterium]
MNQLISIKMQENLPMPLIYLASPEDLARWQIDQMLWSLQQGHRELSISCFDTAPLGYDIAQASAVVLQEVVSFVRQHPEVEHLSILCGDEASYRAYSAHFRMWYKSNHETQST